MAKKVKEELEKLNKVLDAVFKFGNGKMDKKEMGNGKKENRKNDGDKDH